MHYPKKKICCRKGEHTEMNLTISKNHDQEIIDLIKSENVPVIIYGNGEVAMHATLELKTYGIHVSDYAIDKKYLTEKNQDNNPLSPDKIDEKYERYVLIMGFLFGYVRNLSELAGVKQFKNACYVDFISYIPGGDIVERPDLGFYKENESLFDDLYSNLADDFSKKSLLAYMNARINRDDNYLIPCVVLPQYVPQMQGKVESFLKITYEESFLDCGAYTGDTIRDFVQAVGGRYKRIIGCESDLHNGEILEEYIKKENLKNTEIVHKAVYDKKTELCFTQTGSIFSRITDNTAKTECHMQADMIDNIVGETPISFIAMDIEGAEMKALEGARDTILKNKPNMAISAYHKSMDQVDIYRYLKDLVPEYKFYFRIHKPLLADAVLYAVAR